MSKFNGVLVIFCFLVVLSIFTGVASAATWTVNPGDSIQSVVDNASDNDTVIINDRVSVLCEFFYGVDFLDFVLAMIY
mgnify:CR=1 FL=1